MPGRETVGERVAGIDARLGAFEKYTHERWHALNNDLTPLMQLPERMTRDVGKLQGLVDGKITSLSAELQRSMKAAIDEALKPVIAEVAELKIDVDSLKLKSNQMGGAKMLGVFIIQTIIAAATAVGGVLALGRHP